MIQNDCRIALKANTSAAAAAVVRAAVGKVVDFFRWSVAILPVGECIGKPSELLHNKNP